MQTQNRVPEPSRQLPVNSQIKDESKINNGANGRITPSFKELKMGDAVDVTALSNAAYRQLGAVVNYLERTIRKYPLATVSVVAAVGLLGWRMMQTTK